MFPQAARAPAVRTYNVPMIYLDNNATTAIDDHVRAAMLPYLAERYGNPSSVHRFGQEARQAVERARFQVAGLLGCDPKEVLFTSGGTEADNAALHGVLAEAAKAAGNRRILTSAVEHSAVREPLAWLARNGWQVTEIDVDSSGLLDLNQLEEELKRGGVALVTVMWANNETGVVLNVAAVGELAHRHGAVFHCDGVQAAGKIPVDLRTVPIDLLSLSAHKFHGPKGVGALYLRRGVRWSPFVRGGPQERERRGGTENVTGIVGMGTAAELAAAEFTPAGSAAAPAAPSTETRIAALRDHLEHGLLQRIPECFVNGDPAHRVPNTTNIGFAGLEAEAILLLLSEQDLCASAGAACASGSLEPSHVLRAMKLPERIAHGAVRFSLSRYTTEEEIAQALEILPGIIARLRTLL